MDHLAGLDVSLKQTSICMMEGPLEGGRKSS
jgi:hypothetical protein